MFGRKYFFSFPFFFLCIFIFCSFILIFLVLIVLQAFDWIYGVFDIDGVERNGEGEC